MPNGSRSWRAIRLALSTRPLQTRNTAVSGVPSSAALSSRRLRPSAAWRRPLRARYSASPPIQSSPLNVLRTLSGLELPGLLDQPLHAAGEAQDRDHEEQEPDDAEARALPVGRREDVLDRLGAASGQLVAVDDALGRALAPELRGHGAGDDHQRDRRRERAGGQRDRAVESRHLLKPVDDAQHELRPQPERQRPHDALAVHASSPVELGGSSPAMAHLLRAASIGSGCRARARPLRARRCRGRCRRTGRRSPSDHHGLAPPIENRAPIAPRLAPMIPITRP